MIGQLIVLENNAIAILKACGELEGASSERGKPNLRRLRALVLLLRYSGMRIGDAVRCAVERLNGNKLLLYTQKTGVPVYCPLPEFIVKALEELTPLSERYFRRTGISKLQTATGDWQAKLKRLFEKAKLPDGHAHRFCDTFAVELLLAGVPLERVSILLATLAFGLPSGTTRPGCVHVKSKPKLMCGGIGDKIPWRSSKPRVRQRYTERPKWLTSRNQKRKDGGEGGIRTHGRVSPTLAFEASSFNRSDTSPRQQRLV